MGVTRIKQLQKNVISSIDDMPTWFQGRSQTFAIDPAIFLQIKPHNQYSNQGRRKVTGYTPDVNPRALLSVVAAVLNGRWYRLTGNRRAELWRSGDLPMPDQPLQMKVFQAASREDLNDLYKVFSSSSGVLDRDYDRMFRVITSEGMGIRSKNLRFGFFTGALHYAVRGIAPPHAQNLTEDSLDIERVAELFREEIITLDDLYLKADVFSTGVLAAAISALARHPETISIWETLNSGTWTHTREGYDAAGLIYSFITQRRGRNHLTRSPIGHAFMYRLVLSIVEKWLERKANSKTGDEPRFRAVPAPIANLTPIIESLRKVKGQPYDRQLFTAYKHKKIEYLADDIRLLKAKGEELKLDYTYKNPPEPENSQHELNVVKALSLASWGEDYTVSETYEVDTQNAVRVFQNELKTLHAMGLDSLIFTPGVLGAALLSLKIEPESQKMWQRVNQGHWVRGKDQQFDSAGSIYLYLQKFWEKQHDPDQEWIERSFAVCAMAVKSWLRLARGGQGEPKFKSMPRELAKLQEFIETEFRRIRSGT